MQTQQSPTIEDLSTHPVISRDEWLEARKALLKKEKAFTRQKDQLFAECRALPWVKVEKNYFFDTASGKQTLADLFGDKSQLVVTHFMLGPDWEQGCIGCSFGADHYDGIVVHLEHHDVAFVVVSRAPFPKIDAFKKRMGWRFKWVSSYGSDFNYDYHVSFTEEEIAQGKVYYNYAVQPIDIDELAGTSMFYRDAAGNIFHTYSAFARGSELVGGAYGYLDHLPKGRNETGPRYNLGDWVLHHDRYEANER
ncbi:MAG: DUF899 domain-containing protein [Verrucomicrobia bacterium]|nr:DUF899 domain-containing protein [Verrucomicrobiota bacterium]